MITKNELILRMNFDRFVISAGFCYNGVFLSKYIIGQNDTNIIAAMGIAVMLGMVILDPIVSRKDFRQLFNTCWKVFGLMFGSGIIMSIGAYLASGSLLWSYILLKFVDMSLSQPVGAVMRDRFLAVFSGEDQIACGVRNKRWDLIGGMSGTTIAILLPISDMDQVLIVGAAIWVIDAFTTGYTTFGFEQYMKENNIQLCSAKVSTTE